MMSDLKPNDYQTAVEQILGDPKFRAALVKRVGSNQEMKPRELLPYIREAVTLWVEAIETSAIGRVVGSAADKAGVDFKANVHHSLPATRQNAGFK